MIRVARIGSLGMGSMKFRWSLPLVALLGLLLGAGCGGDDDDAAGDFTIVEEGDGPANTLPLRTLSNGDRFGVGRFFGAGGDNDGRAVITRGPFQMGDFEVYRDILDSQRAASLNAEIFHVEDENGVWLVGGSEDGLLPGGILTVPATVRLGMRWKSSPGSSFEDYTFEVTDRLVLDSDLGQDSVLWQIGQIFEGDTGPTVYRWYAEGWGQLHVSNEAAGEPQNFTSGERLVPGAPVREAALLTEFDLTPAGQHDLSLRGDDDHRLSFMRGIRSVDGARTNLSFVGNIDSQNSGLGTAFTYAAGDGSAPGFFARRAFASWNEPLLESRSTVAFAGYYDYLDVVGNAIYTAAGLFASTTDHLFFENAAGGVNGFRADIPQHTGNTGVTFLAEETVVTPGFTSLKGQLWGVVACSDALCREPIARAIGTMGS